MADWLAAVGTISAVVVALVIAMFGDYLRRRRWHPTLSIEVHCSPPDCHKTKMAGMVSFAGRDTSLEAECFYYRVRVKNTGNDIADTVELYLAQVERREEGGNWVSVEEFLPMNLRWSHLGAIFFPKIPPEMEKHCDLFHILDPAERGSFPAEDNPALALSQGQALLSVDLIVKPNTLTHLLPPGIYRFTLVAAAANAKTSRATLIVNHSGSWHGDEGEMLSKGTFIVPQGEALP